MNGEQVILLGAIIGVVAFVLLLSRGRKPSKAVSAPAASSRPLSRAERRRKH
jgi:hypothetical protein